MMYFGHDLSDDLFIVAYVVELVSTRFGLSGLNFISQTTNRLYEWDKDRPETIDR
jgi:hypothetical protein